MPHTNPVDALLMILIQQIGFKQLPANVYYHCNSAIDCIRCGATAHALLHASKAAAWLGQDGLLVAEDRLDEAVLAVVESMIGNPMPLPVVKRNDEHSSRRM